MQRVTHWLVVVILGRETLQVSQQFQPRAVRHLLNGLKVQPSSQTVESKPAHVSQEERKCNQRQPAQTSLRNDLIDQQSDDQRIDENQNACCKDARITRDIQA